MSDKARTTLGRFAELFGISILAFTTIMIWYPWYAYFAMGVIVAAIFACKRDVKKPLLAALLDTILWPGTVTFNIVKSLHEIAKPSAD